MANYEAEFGRRSGPSINIITRGGSQDFHGSAYYYRRDDELAANSFLRNKFGQPKAEFGLQTRGFSIGGPVYIPGVFNEDKKKLFFFFGFNQQPNLLPPPLVQRQMPSALERMGDFSDTRDNTGAVVPIIDPTTGAAFPGNIIPSNRISPIGQSILNYFPSPNTSDPRFNYNVSGLQRTDSIQEEMVRIDWVVNDRLSIFGRWIRDSNPIVTDFITNYSNVLMAVPRLGKSASMRATYTISPKVITDFTFGHTELENSNGPANETEANKILKGPNGINLGQLSPESNPDGFIPLMSFGSLPNGGTAPVIQNNFTDAFEYQVDIVGNLTWINGNHAFKFGFFYERGNNETFPGGRRNPKTGSFNFQRDPNNPNETGHPFANALTGTFRQYDELVNTRKAFTRFNTLEWYFQDHWRVSSKLTLDIGLRFYWQPPEFEREDRMAGFVPEQYDPNNAVRLYVPGPGGTAQDPLTGNTVSRLLTNSIVPGSGDVNNGMAVGRDSFLSGDGVKLGPRFGFAYDPFGNGDTVIRGGFGMYFDRLTTGAVEGRGTAGLIFIQPLVSRPRLFYGDLESFLDVGEGAQFTQDVASFSGVLKPGTTMNFSFGVQRRIGDLFVFDIAYVGSLGRHLADAFDHNTLPLAARFDRAFEDPTRANRALADPHLRPFIGYNAIRITEFGGSSNYNSMQVMATRRFGNRFTFNTNYTWAKTLQYGGSQNVNNLRSFLLPPSDRDYGQPLLSAPHIFNVMFMYQLPDLSDRMGGSGVASYIFGDWRVTGTSQIASGERRRLGIDGNSARATGSTEGARIRLVGDPRLEPSQRTADQWLNASAVARPTAGVFGVSGPDAVDPGNGGISDLRGPGRRSWNFSVIKDIRVYETHRVQFRFEFYNAFNHTNFRRLDYNARFNAAGVQTDAGFGRVISVHNPRTIQWALRYDF